MGKLENWVSKDESNFMLGLKDLILNHEGGKIVLAKGFRISPALFKISEMKFASDCHFVDIAMPRRHYSGIGIFLEEDISSGKFSLKLGEEQRLKTFVGRYSQVYLHSLKPEMFTEDTLEIAKNYFA